MNSQVTAVVLAGGRARRMGGEDKGLLSVAGRPMVAWVCDALAPQCAAVLINANRNHAAYAEITGHEVVSDRHSDFQGPLAGMASALTRVSTPLMVTCPCDSPLVHGALVERLVGALVRDDAEIAVAHDGERMQPVFALVKRDLGLSLDAFLARGERKIDRWFAEHRVALALFEDTPDMFLNVNTPHDRACVEARLGP